MPELHHSFDNIPKAARNAVLAIGNFDGVHLGHRFLIAEAGKTARARGLPLAVMTFEPHPREFFQKNGAPFRLTLLPLKRRLMAEIGVQHLFSLPFDADFAMISGENFVRDILVGCAEARHIVVGDDFAFGRGRSGNVETLRAAADDGTFGLTALAPLRDGGNLIYSSSRIREHLSRAEFDAAAELLGWRWSFMDTVVHGDRRGHALGYPTANQEVLRYTRLPYGVYAVRARVEGMETWHGGIANFGIRPMFKVPAPLFETHLFDFSDEIYGKLLEVQPLRFLRAEMSFSEIAALKEQIAQDCLAARSVLKSFR